MLNSKQNGNHKDLKSSKLFTNMKTFFIIKNSLYPEWYELQLLSGKFYSLRRISNNWQANNLPISKEIVNKVLTASGFCSCSEAYFLGTEKLFKLLSFLGWTPEDWVKYTVFAHEQFMPIQNEKDEEEAAYWKDYDQPEGYAWPNGNPYESETYRHYGIFPSWW